jgi:hypothetical protein
MLRLLTGTYPGSGIASTPGFALDFASMSLSVSNGFPCRIPLIIYIKEMFSMK